jgi:outer membrane receptor protein involved in Fe transport
VVYNDLDFDYGVMANYSSTRYDQRIQLRVHPLRASLYLQDKLETKGFIMNAGLRLDYSNSNTQWWDVDPYDKYFFSSKYDESLSFPKKTTSPQLQLSPRLGISHPISENAKLFFNYGHFKQMPSYETLFRINRSTDNKMAMYGDPDLILAKTISYELGYDHTLFNDYLLQVAAFYHDIADQQNTTQYTSVAGVAYTHTTSNSYADIRGFEFTLRKNRGRWWTFFGNYTYQVTTSGHFGRAEVYEDPSRQREYDEATVNLYQERPTPRPYARLNVSLYTPDDFGPVFLGFHPAGGYMANLLLNWQAGAWATFNPNNIASIANNVQETDYFDSVLRLAKSFRIRKFRVEGFVDVSNLFNYKRMSMTNFGGKTNDRELYNNSLHLPVSTSYDNIPGDDRMGSYRKDGVAYQPMFPRGVIDYSSDKGETGVIYYDKNTQRYVEYVSETWRDVDKARLNQILEDKAYIDMPDQSSFTFFNPRQVFFGLRVSFDLN